MVQFERRLHFGSKEIPVKYLYCTKERRGVQQTFVAGESRTADGETEALSRLHGLCIIHHKGWMHRDITPQNMLYFKGDPPEAALYNFGKLLYGKTHTDTGLAAWMFLPPEIVQGRSNPYDQKIDIWMLAFALVLSWFPQAYRGVTCLPNRQIGLVGLKVMRSNLQNIKSSGLAHLLREMLSEDPKHRPDPSRALSHQCFRHLKTDLPQETASSDGKRRHPGDEAGEKGET